MFIGLKRFVFLVVWRGKNGYLIKDFLKGRRKKKLLLHLRVLIQVLLKFREESRSLFFGTIDKPQFECFLFLFRGRGFSIIAV